MTKKMLAVVSAFVAVLVLAGCGTNTSEVTVDEVVTGDVVTGETVEVSEDVIVTGDAVEVTGEVVEVSEDATTGEAAQTATTGDFIVTVN